MPRVFRPGREGVGPRRLNKTSPNPRLLPSERESLQSVLEEFELASHRQWLGPAKLRDRILALGGTPTMDVPPT